ncbi:hypothetical protein FSP39_023968 [Pinctada imbricata]|uniref:Protein phosphatase 1 regulatory subunit 12B n=1 Tax=Pinctada imbricata TaxID=66713 RepID=A0AA88YKY3_PINIB|nr:hypothetical protein FSP39_023968 [Pinctada imbricata]
MDPAVMAEQASALIRRHEQLKRWNDSDTNKAPGEILDKPRKVKFQDGCVFLAACSSGDRDEVSRLLKRGADINTANVDGLTALHQACIDDNLEMVEFLVENGADVDVCDNEGWTPLHATASCGFTDIARYLIEQGGNVAAVNNDGDLPFDICEDEEMEKVLQEEMDKQEIDADAARAEEENQMLADANKWLNNKTVKEKRHPKTGATALHVACAKGYMKVISVLLQAGADINSKDYDGWTPLHAAAHWGQEEACKVLVDNMCDMETKNNAGQTSFDVADNDIIKLLDELKKKQASQKDKMDSQNEIISTKGLHQKRRSSVTRMSGDQKQNVISKTVEQERITLEAALHQHPAEEEEKEEKEEKSLKSSSSSGSEVEEGEEEEEGEESSGSETEKQNEINKMSSNQQPRDRDKPPITTVEIQQKPETLKIDEKGESAIICKKDHQNEDDRTENGMDEVPKIEKIGDSLNKLNETKNQIEDEEKEKSEKEKEGNEKKMIGDSEGSTKPPRVPLNRSLSLPAKSPSDSQVPIISLQKPQENEKEVTKRDIPSWRAGLRKVGSSSMVIETINEVDTKNLPRSASSPRLADTNSLDNIVICHYFLYHFLHHISTTAAAVAVPTRRIAAIICPAPRPTNQLIYRTTGDRRRTRENVRRNVTRPYEPPKRDEEAETQRKARAKRARETRRSTQGVTLEDIQKAEEVLSSAKSDADRRDATSTTTTSSASDNKRDTTSSVSDRLRDSTSSVLSRDNDLGVSSRTSFTLDSAKKDGDSYLYNYSTLTIALFFVTAYIPRRDRKAFSSSLENSSLSAGTSLTRSQSLRNRLKNEEEQKALENQEDKKDRVHEPIATSVTRSQSLRTRIRRDDADNLLDSTSTREERREKDSIHLNVTREEKKERDKDKDEKTGDNRRESAALQRRRMRRERRSTGIISYEGNNEDDEKDEDQQKEEEKDKKETEEKLGLRHCDIFAMSYNPYNRYSLGSYPSLGSNYSSGSYTSGLYGSSFGSSPSSPFSSGIGSSYSSRSGSTSSISSIGSSYSPALSSYRNYGSRYSSRYGSTSDVPYNRPSSYIEQSRSTPSLDSLDYKRMYEDEKSSNDRLKRELEHTKKELVEAKAELDRLVRRNEAARVSDTNEKREKRALERKLSEYEEELKKLEALKEENKKLKDENGALIRVISKLSK